MTTDVPAVLTGRRFTVPHWLGLLLKLVALSELLSGLSALPILAGNWDETPGPAVGGRIILIYIVLRPALAFVALLLLNKQRLQPALYCLAAIAALEWANMMPSVMLHGLQSQDGDTAWRVALLFEVFVKPVFAVTTIALAMLRFTPTIAGLLAVAPTMVGWIGVLAFAVSVAVNGF